MQAFSLSQKVAVITGAGSGIGKSIAEVFSRHSAKVYILDVDESSATKVVEQITSNGGEALYRFCNVASQTEVRQVIQHIADENEKIDILVNNAGVAHVGNVEKTSEEDLDRIYSINIKGVYNCLYACIPYMKAQGGGVILNLASVASVLGIADRFAYSMSKGAVLTMTLSVAKDYVADNIRCNSIAPGRVHTPFVDGFLKKNYPGKESEMFEKLSKTQPIGRMGKPEEIANLALFLCSDEAGFITGSNYPIDGGFITLNS
ncbi:2-keto-3-deoxy-L-fuconate dehydrogenase [Catalinimonas alkaloidigena]|uniref:SDR family NAD(P)-dependent oxidoreductase n=1 Tax=Catalinimonas alkaloidigena TaxID=1075417 RepID=UPI0024063DE2|nr:SDR family oxidoreductase [Catalinimonas alkaloidigena]MDF9795603.1 2-keto-3-deoxy-L-fuconate dehydrogenase [Catalinimonas alkaloidigena]